MSIRKVVDGNEAVALVAHRLSEVVAIYPITPATPMAESIDAWAAADKPNLWGDIPKIIEMQSEAGAAGAAHGSLLAGSLTETFTSSQGLMLMLPDMYKIAGELLPFVVHVAARSLATHALSIFGDHSDVYASRTTGFAMLASASPQEAHDMAAVSFAASLESKIPFLHFFDGFRTSHEIDVIDSLSDEDLKALIDEEWIYDFRRRALSPEHPTIRGTAQNPDVFFQAREAATPYYTATPEIVEGAFTKLFAKTGRQYRLFDYVGAPDAERVIIAMGSSVGAIEGTVNALNKQGEKVGLVKVHLYRPFSPEALSQVLPESVQSIAVLDRTKDAAAVGEPLYEDVVSALLEKGRLPKTIIGGRYGLSSKEFNPAMVKAVFDELNKEFPKRHFTVGINDDLSHSSLEWNSGWSIEPDDVTRCLFYGVGADGTVGANKNSAKIIAEETDLFAQGYFVYDSKKSGSTTVSHLRFGPRPINSTYLIKDASFIACHQFSLLSRLDVLEHAAPGAVFLLNSPYGKETWDHLPLQIQKKIKELKLRLFVVDAGKVAREAGLAGRVNTVLQTCFFALADVIPQEQAISAIKRAIKRTYTKKGPEIVSRNNAAVDLSLSGLEEIKPGELTATTAPSSYAEAPSGLQLLLAGRGDELPTSAFSPDGTFETGTSHFEKRSLANEIPSWDEEICISCGKCTLVCPHAAIRMKAFKPELLDDAPEGFKSREWKGRDLPGYVHTIAISPVDCTGCTLCFNVCPVVSKQDPDHKALNMIPKEQDLERTQKEWDFAKALPEIDRSLISTSTIKGSQLLEPLFEFSGACSGCGETPYVKLLSQLFGDRLIVANATGCSSIYGGNLPTTPWTKNAQGQGPAWANSLFEDNAEFGYGIRMASDMQQKQASDLLAKIDLPRGHEELRRDILANLEQFSEEDILLQRGRVQALRELLYLNKDPKVKSLRELLDSLIRRSVWLVGGDGWAYDIGFGGLDHVLASGQNINVLVLDTEVYSNTGGQASKSTPKGATAKFAAGGKATKKKDLGMMIADYGNVYVAQIALNADNNQAIKALNEAENYPGSSLVIAYATCISHGLDLSLSLPRQKEAVDSGYWPLYRYDPRLESPLQLDSRAPKTSVSEFMAKEGRFAALGRSNPKLAQSFAAEAEADVLERRHWYEHLAAYQKSSVTDPPR